MATSKKKRKQSASSANPRSYGTTRPDASRSVGESATNSSASSDLPRASAAEIDWSKEYGYVANDIIQLAVVSGVLFIAMFAVGFFL